jgi:hypothetical protein
MSHIKADRLVQHDIDTNAHYEGEIKLSGSTDISNSFKSCKRHLFFYKDKS